MRLIEFVKERSSLLVLSLLALGVAGYEWQKIRREGVIPAAEAKPAAQGRGVLAEGRVAVYPGAEVTLGAELSGKLVALGVKERDQVKAGDVIAELDVSEQRAALGEAWARVKEAQNDIDYFTLEQDRSEQLFAQSVIAAAARDKSAHDGRAARGRKSSLVAAASRLQVVLDKAKLRAPFDGTVTARLADAGEMVAAGAPLVTITDLSKLRVEAEVGEFDSARVRLGAEVRVTAEGYEDQVWKGRVEEIPDTVGARQMKPLDPARPVDTRVLLVKVKLLEPVPLKLGQRVEVEIAR